MKVTFDRDSLAFVFRGLASNQVNRLVMCVSEVLNSNPLMRGYDAWLCSVEESIRFVQPESSDDRDRREYDPRMVQLIFYDAEAAMAFRMGFVDGDEFIPWRDGECT